MYSLADKLTIC